MIVNLAIAGAVIVFVLGLWIGLGAPGWPVPPQPRERRLRQRNLNPISWGRQTQRERLTPRNREERRARLR